MNRLVASCAALLLACAAPAYAQIDGQLSTAVPVAVDQRLFGLHGGFSTRQSDLYGQLRLCFYPGLDFGFHGGLAHLSAYGRMRTVLVMGGDLKTLVARRTDTFPVDIALGGAIGVGNAQGFGVMGMGPLAVASRAYSVGDDDAFTPYGGVALLFSRSNIDDTDGTAVSLQLRLGAEYRPNPDVRFVIEVQTPTSDPIDRHPKLLVGANFPF